MKSVSTYWARVKLGVFYISLGMFVGLTFIVIPRTPLNYIYFAPAFGVVMTVLVIWPLLGIGILIDYLYLKSAFRQYGVVDYNLHQFREIVAPLSKERVLKYIADFMKQEFKIRDIDIDYRRGLINATTKMTLLTWGQKIDVVVKENQDGQSLIQILSEPKKKTAVFDLGMNLRNAEQIAKHLKTAR